MVSVSVAINQLRRGRVTSNISEQSQKKCKSNTTVNPNHLWSGVLIAKEKAMYHYQNAIPMRVNRAGRYYRKLIKEIYGITKIKSCD